MSEETTLANEKKFTLPSYLNLYFSASILIIAFINVNKHPALNIHGEMIGEMGKIYFQDAMYKSLYHNLTTIVAAYIPMTERLLSLFVVKVLGCGNYFPWLVQWACVALISVCCSLVNLKQFKVIIEDDLSRFFIALMLGSYVYFDGMKLYNSAYIGSLFILWTLFLKKEEFPIWKLIVLFLGMFIFLIGKAHYIAFAPFHGLLILWAFKNKQMKTMFFYMSIFIVHLIQLGITLSIKEEWDKRHADLGTINLTGIIEYAFKYLFYDIASLGGPFFLSLNIYLLIFITIGILGFALYKNIKNKSITLLFFVICMILSLLSLAFSIKGFPDYATTKKLVEHYTSYHYRHFLFSDTLITLGVCALFYKAFGVKYFRPIAIVLVLILMFNNNTFPNHNPKDSASKWEVYRELLKEDDYCIPTWTYTTWLMTKNCEKLGMCTVRKGSEALMLEHLKAIKLNPENWSLRGFIMAQSTGYQKEVLPLYALALDKTGKVLSKTKSMVPPDYKYQYFRFNTHVTPTFIILSNEFNKKQKFPSSHLLFFGKKLNQKTLN